MSRSARPSAEDCLRELADRALALRVVGEGLPDGNLAGAPRRDAALHQLPGVDEEARADALLQPARLQVAHLLAELGQLEGDLDRGAALVRDHLRLLVARRVVELDGDEALAG